MRIPAGQEKTYVFIPLISQSPNETTGEVFKEKKEEICNAKDREEEE